MNHRYSFLALTVVFLATSPAAAESLDEVLTKVYDARGGLKNIRSVESARISGTYDMGMMQAAFTMEWKRPDRLRISFTTPQGDGVQAYDGEKAWVKLPGQGIQEISGDQADALRRQADLIDGPLVDWKDKGNSVEYLGEGDYEGTPVLKLGLSRPDGTETTIFIDAADFLPIHQSGSMKMQGMETDVETYISDYRKVGELMMAHTVKTELIDVGMTQTVTMETVELNADVPDDRFAMPAPEPAAEPVPAGAD